MNKSLRFFEFLVFIFFVAPFVFLIGAVDPAGPINMGDVALVPDGMLVTIMNPRGIKGKDFFFSFGDTAKIDYPGIVIAFGATEDRVLVFYKRTQEGRGVMCPNGGYFFLDKKTFLEWKAGKAAEVQKKKRALRNLVKKLTKIK